MGWSNKGLELTIRYWCGVNRGLRLL